MECAILVARTNDLSGLVEAFLRDLESDMNPTSFSMSFDRTSKGGRTRLLVLEELLQEGLTVGFYCGTVQFESEEDGKCIITIVTTGGPADFRSRPDHRLLDSIKDPLLKVGEEVSIVYESAWLWGTEEMRRKAVSSLERIGGVVVVDTLIHILLHDPNNQISEDAAHSIGRVGGDDAIDALVKAAKRWANLVKSCAESLGEMHSRKSVESLKELLAYFEGGEQTLEAGMVRSVIQSVRQNQGDEESICSVCNQNIEEGEEAVGCPTCRRLAHKVHMLEWLHVHGRCPSCGHDLTEPKLLAVQVQQHQPKQDHSCPS
jgi:hypothetical protein